MSATPSGASANLVCVSALREFGAHRQSGGRRRHRDPAIACQTLLSHRLATMATIDTFLSACRSADAHTVSGMLHGGGMPCRVVRGCDARKRSAMWHAAHANRADVLAVLMSHYRTRTLVSTDVDGRTPLHAAALRGATAAVRALLKHGQVDINARDRTGATPLYLACAAGHLGVVKALCEDKRVNVALATSTARVAPVAVAAQRRHPQIVRYLVESAHAQVSDPVDRDGATVFALACQGVDGSAGSTQLLRYLAGLPGVSPGTARDNGRTPLHDACSTNSAGARRVAEVLVTMQGVDVDTVDRDGNTPLHHACETGALAQARLLLQLAGAATINARNAR